MKRKRFIWGIIISTILFCTIFFFTQKYSANFTDDEPLKSVDSADRFGDYARADMSADSSADLFNADGNGDIHFNKPERPVSKASAKEDKKSTNKPERPVLKTLAREDKKPNRKKEVKIKKENRIELINGVTNFVLPSTMFVDTSYMGYLGISTYLTYSQLHKFLEKTFYEENPILKEATDSLILSQGGKDKIKIYPVMKAELRDVTLESKKFDVTSISPDWQVIDLEDDSVFIWRWNVTPKAEGIYRLQFNIYGSLNISHENNKHVLLFNKEVKVKTVKVPLSTWDNIISIAKSINDYGGVLTTGLCGTLLFFFRDKILGLFKKGKPNEPKL